MVVSNIQPIPNLSLAISGLFQTGPDQPLLDLAANVLSPSVRGYVFAAILGHKTECLIYLPISSHDESEGRWQTA